MSLGRKGPLHPQVIPETDNEDPLALLWNPVISGVHEPDEHVVAQRFVMSVSVLSLQAREMIRPGFILSLNHLRVGELETNVLQILGEGLARQTLHILDEHGSRPKFPHRPHHLGKHVALVLPAPMPTALGKGLAWRTSSH